MAVQHRLPIGGNPVANGWTASSGTPDKHLEYDDPVGNPDEDATYIYRQNSNGNQAYVVTPFDVPQDATIERVSIITRARLGAGECVVRNTLRVDGQNANAANSPIGANYQDWQSDWITNPTTGQAWTVDELADIEYVVIGALGMQSGDEARVTQSYLEVEYTEDGGGNVYDETLGLSADASMTPSRTVTMTGTLSLTAAAAVAPQRRAALAGTVRLAADAAITQAAAAVLQARAEMAAQAALSVEGTLTLDQAITLVADAVLEASHVYQPGGGGAVYDETIALTAGAALSPSAVADLVAALPLTAHAHLAPFGQLVVHATAAFAAQAHLTATGGLTLTDQITLTAAASMTPAAQRTIAAQLALEVEAGLQALVAAQLQAAVGLEAHADLVARAAAQMTAGVTLALSTELAALAQVIGESHPDFLRLIGAALVSGSTLQAATVVSSQLRDVQVEPE